MPDERRLETLIVARYPIIVVETHEERRFIEMLELLATRREWPLFTWNVTDGLSRRRFGQQDRENDTFDLQQALYHLYKSPQNGVIVFMDAHPFMDDPVNVRLFKTLVEYRERTQRTLIFVSHALDLPPELQRFSTRFSLAMPDATRIKRLIKEEAEAWSSANNNVRVKADPDAVAQLIRLLNGLTIDDARRLVREAVQDDGAILPNDLKRIEASKNALFNQDGLLSLENQTTKFGEIGGLGGLKSWLALRRAAFFGEVSGLDTPKGILLTGIQGCGKSLAAKSVAGSWGIPLLRLDVGVLYNKYHGETERNLRQALSAADAMAPCVLWVDEIEKGVDTQSGSADGGASKRLLGTLLTWMAERAHPVFIVATSNDITGLPPELIRKGRLDEIFFVDLPEAAVRADIFHIHLARRQQNPAEFDLSALAHACDGFSGAEIEQAIVSALYSAYASQTKISTQTILDALARTQPLSIVMAEQLESMREWAENRAVRAEGDETDEANQIAMRSQDAPAATGLAPHERNLEFTPSPYADPNPPVEPCTAAPLIPLDAPPLVD